MTEVLCCVELTDQTQATLVQSAGFQGVININSWTNEQPSCIWEFAGGGKKQHMTGGHINPYPGFKKIT